MRHPAPSTNSATESRSPLPALHNFQQTACTETDRRSLKIQPIALRMDWDCIDKSQTSRQHIWCFRGGESLAALNILPELRSSRAMPTATDV
jgi:hypothetical protein